MIADFVVLALPFAVLDELDISRRRIRRAEAPGHRRTGTRPQRQAASAVRRARLAWYRPVAGRVQRLELCGHRLSGRHGRRPAPKAASPESWSSTRADRPPTRRPPARRSPLANNGGVRTDAAIAQSQIATVYPGLSWNGKATQSLPHKSPFFGASYSFYKVGQYTTFGGYEARASGRSAVLRRAHVNRFPGLHGGRGVGGTRAARQIARMMGGSLADTRSAASA